MAPKKKNFQRTLSGILAAAMIFGLVAAHIPGMVNEAEAVDAQSEALPSYHVSNRDRKDGLYLFYPAGQADYAMDVSAYGTQGSEINTVLDEAKTDDTQRFVVQIDENYSGTDKVGSDAAYGLRSVISSYWLGSSADGARVVQTANRNYRNDSCRWQFINNADGTVLIKHVATGKYFCWDGYGKANTLQAAPADGVFTNAYKWNMTQTHMPESFFLTGIYWIETRVASAGGTLDGGGTKAMSAPVNTVTIAAPGDATTTRAAYIGSYVPADEYVYGEIDTSKEEKDYERQQFVIQKISGGFYSITNVATGCYLGLDSLGNVVNGGSSAGKPAASERWIIYPATLSGNSTQSSETTGETSGTVSRMRIISAVDGRQLTVQQTNTDKTTLSGATSTLAVSPMENKAVQDWYLQDVRFDVNNVSRGDTVNSNTGVFADTFDTNATVTLPIKIFDYAADGMLFEYAAVVENAQYHYEYVGANKGNYTYNAATGEYLEAGIGQGDYQRYRMGNNLGFGMVSRSSGGSLGIPWDTTQDPDGRYAAYGSNSFDYNKYWCPYLSELRLNDGNDGVYDYPTLNTDRRAYERTLHYYVLAGKAGTSYENFKPMVLVEAGGMNVTGGSINYTTDPYVSKALGYAMFGQQTFGTAVMGLMESDLHTVVVDGKSYTLPRYRQETVEYIAMVMQRALEIRAESLDGTKNYNYVDGETSFADLASGLDLAALLRGDTKVDPDNATGVLEYEDGTVLTTNFTKYGSYADTMTKSAQLIGTWDNVKGNIKTCMDAAYWMLNSLFLEGSFNQPQDRYNSLILTQVTDQDGRTGYIFDSTFINNSSSEVSGSAVEYDSQNGTIRNTSAAGKSYTYWRTNRTAATYAFLPVRTDRANEDGSVSNGDGSATDYKGIQNQTNTPYFMDGGIIVSDKGEIEPEYQNANYNFVLQSNAYFVYHEDDQLFFEFEGDDDVYLFINGELVLDIGGAHSVTGTKMNLNDYVNWARAIKADTAAYNALSAKERERVNALALVEGDTYSFDFYYMERHGWGSNMRIFTNFQLASGRLEAAKSAQQDDKSLSYGSVVDESKNVEYTFELSNTGTANLVMPTFADADIGVTVSYNTGLTVAEGFNGVTVFDKDGQTLEFSDLIFTYQKVGATDPVQYQFDTQDAMTNWLTHELVLDRHEEGTGTYGRLTVGGIYYHLTNEQILEGAFHNEVVVSAFVRNDGESKLNGETGGPLNVATGGQLYDSAQFSVFLLSRPLYYHWRDNQLEITVQDVLAEVQPAANDRDNPLSNLVKPTITAITDVRLTDDRGQAVENTYVSIDPDTLNIYADYQTTGIKLIHLTIDYTYKTTDEDGQLVDDTATATIPVQIFVLDVSSSVYVLDYGLHVELTFEELMNSDVVTVEGRSTVMEVLGVANENSVPVYVSRANASQGNVNSIRFDSVAGNGGWKVTNTASDSYYGSFDVSGNTANSVFVTYTPEEFMEGRDDIYVAIRVREADSTPDAMGSTDIHNEVEMFKKITVLPANVMYYEDDFKDITYLSDKNVSQTGEHGKPQNSAQSEQYGHDGNAYSNSADVTASGGSITEITLNEEGLLNAASFTFQGTGFEMISRTNAVDSAMIQIKVTGKFDGTNVTTKYYPIITQFDHISTTGSGGVDTDQVYQVPVFRLADLPYGSFDVTISGVPTYEFDEDFNASVKQTKLYIDGIRIYNPLGTGSVSEYGDEDGAVFTELRTLIFDSKAAAIGLETDDTGAPSYSGAFGHLSFTEDLNGWFRTYKGDLRQFAIAGPNNEVYVDGTGENNYAVVLYVKPTSDEKGLLQLGVHDLHDSDFYGTGNTNAASGIRYWTAEGWSDEISIGKSGTEQYYPIDYTKCPKVGDYYCVTVQVSSGMVSFTNVKTVGLSFGTMEHDDAYQLYRYENGVLQASADGEVWTEVSAPVVGSVLAMRSILRSNVQAPDVEFNPEHGDTDMVWAVALIGLCSVVCLVSLTRKGARL